MRRETQGMIGWMITKIIFVVIMLLMASGCTPREPSWKMLSRGADAIFWDLHVLDRESGDLASMIREKPGGSELGWELQAVMMKVREAKWIAKEAGEKMRVLHEQQNEREERRKVLDKPDKP